MEHATCGKMFVDAEGRVHACFFHEPASTQLFHRFHMCLCALAWWDVDCGS